MFATIQFISRAASYGCGTWSLTLREKQTGNRVLRGVSEPKRERSDRTRRNIMRGFKIFAFHENFLRMMKPRNVRWVAHAACVAAIQVNVYKFAIRKPEGRRGL
jgi:hypothetical protein